MTHTHGTTLTRIHPDERERAFPYDAAASIATAYDVTDVATGADIGRVARTTDGEWLARAFTDDDDDVPTMLWTSYGDTRAEAIQALLDGDDAPGGWIGSPSPTTAREQLATRVRSLINRDAIARLRDGLDADDPRDVVRSLVGADHVVRVAADNRVLSELAELIDDGATGAVAVDWLNNYVHVRAGGSSRSTSPTSNLMDRELLRAHAWVLGKYRRDLLALDVDDDDDDCVCAAAAAACRRVACPVHGA